MINIKTSQAAINIVILLHSSLSALSLSRFPFFYSITFRKQQKKYAIIIVFTWKFCLSLNYISKKKILLDFFLERMKSGLRARYIQRKYIQQSNEIIIRLNGIRNTRWSLELCETCNEYIYFKCRLLAGILVMILFSFFSFSAPEMANIHALAPSKVFFSNIHTS